MINIFSIISINQQPNLISLCKLIERSNFCSNAAKRITLVQTQKCPLKLIKDEINQSHRGKTICRNIKYKKLTYICVD